MEVWTFISNKSNEIIRFNVIRTDDDCFDTEYFFTIDKNSPMWFVESKEMAEDAYNKFTHPQYRMFYKNPSTDGIDINEYRLVEFKM